MGFNPAIREKVRRLALDKKSQLTAKDVFMSEELRRYLESLALSMGNGSGETKIIQIADDQPDGPVAYTNGARMYLNANSDFYDFFDSLESKFLGFMGNFFHEKAHDLFHDFNEERSAMRYISNGLFYGEKPQKMNAKQEADWTDMEDALNAPHTRKIFETLFHELANCIADRHDEDCLIDSFGAFVGESLYLDRQAVQAPFTFFETAERDVNRGDAPELPFMLDNILQLCLFDEILARSQEAVETSDYWQSLEKMREHIQVACVTDDSQRLYSELNWILLYFWPYIRNEIQKIKDQAQSGNNQQSGSQGSSGQQGGSQGNQGQQPNQQNGQPGQQPNQQNGQSGQQGQQNQQQSNQQGGQGGQPSQNGGNGNSQNPPKTTSLTPEQVQQLLQTLSSGNPMPKRDNPTGQHSSDIAITRRADERNGKPPEKNQAAAKAATNAMQQQGKEAIYQAMESILNQIAKDQAEAELELDAASSLSDAVVAVNAAGPHKGIPVKTHRILNVGPADMLNYERIMKDLKPISNRLQKQMLEALRDLREGNVQKHRQFGRTIVPTDTYRPDQRFFANKKLPQDLPDMAVSILADNSGSTDGERIQAAMLSSVLLHDFCTGLNIPIAVAGHNAVMGGGVNYFIFADYEQISNKDKYRAAKLAATMTKMNAHNSNRDGCALNIAAKLLEKRPEQVKLLIVISDGRPNHTGYGGEMATKDIQEIVKQCKQKGIEVIACAIGDDKNNIRTIYGDGFIDISDLKTLPKTLVSIVKKRIINSAF